jgi:hypothetical protein
MYMRVIIHIASCKSPNLTVAVLQVVKRVMKRDGVSEKAAKRRMEAQLTNKEYVQHANVIFSTQWEPEYTQKQVRTLLHVPEIRIDYVAHPWLRCPFIS